MRSILIACSLLFGHCTSFLHGCTDFQIAARNGTIVCARSMEFGIPLKTKITVHPRGECLESQAPDKQSGLSWASSYGFIAAACLDEQFVTDGINEEGLSVGLLWLPGTEYQKSTPDMFQHSIAIEDVAMWLLGVCASVDDVVEMLPKVVVWGHEISQLHIPPMHIAVHDANGHNLVVEFVSGRLRMYRNPNGVLTNAPFFDWQIMNLRNYVNLCPMNAAPLQLDGMMIPQAGQGSGLLGLPGDSTPPSRFVKISLLKNFAVQPKNASTAVNLAVHLLNTVDIPLGTVRATNVESNWENTQWAVVKDLSNKVFYYRTYDAINLCSIDLKKIDFTQPQHAFAIDDE